MNKKTERQDKNPAPEAPEPAARAGAGAAPADEPKPQRRGGLYQMSADGRCVLLHRTSAH